MPIIFNNIKNIIILEFRILMKQTLYFIHIMWSKPD